MCQCGWESLLTLFLKEESVEHPTTIAVDLAKSVFEVSISREPGRVCQRKRLTRGQFARFLALQPSATVLMEACGTAHYWARLAQPPARQDRPHRHTRTAGGLPQREDLAGPRQDPCPAGHRLTPSHPIRLACYPHGTLKHHPRPPARARHRHPARCKTRSAWPLSGTLPGLDPRKPPCRLTLSRLRNPTARGQHQRSRASARTALQGSARLLIPALCPGHRPSELYRLNRLGRRSLPIQERQTSGKLP